VWKVNLRVGIITDQYPSSRNPDRGTFVRDLVDHLRSAKVDVAVIDHAKNFAAMSLECLIRSTGLDIFDAQFIAPAGVVAALTPRAAPLVITVHRWDVLEFPYRWPMAAAATRLALRSARGIIAVGHAILSEVTRFVTSSSRIVTIPNAVDTKRFGPHVQSVSLKRTLGIPEDHRVILSVGHLIPRKGFQYLMRAMSDVLRRFDACSLVIAGRGPLRDELHGLGNELRLGGKLKLIGVVDESTLPSLYAMSDIFVMPSFSEGHCVSILEAMSSAKPIVASAIPGNAESVAHGQNGFLVCPGDVAALADATVRLLRDEALREKLGRNSRERAVMQFGWDLKVRRLVDFYESAIT